MRLITSRYWLRLPDPLQRKLATYFSRVAEWLKAPAVKAGGVRDPREFESRLEGISTCVWVCRRWKSRKYAAEEIDRVSGKFFIQECGVMVA